MVAEYLIPVVKSGDCAYALNCIKWVAEHRLVGKRVKCCHACYTDVSHKLWPYRRVDGKMNAVCCSIGSVCLL